MAIRCFLAFELPPPIKGILDRVVGELKPFPLDMKWVKTDNIHLTVVFLGQIQKGTIGAIENTADTVCRQYGSFQISLKSMGTFGSKKYPRVLWIGIDGDIKRLGFFRDQLQENLAPLGINVEKRPFKPHLTLGRFRKGTSAGFEFTEILRQHEVISSPVCSLKHLCLFKSELKPSGAVYTRMGNWPLSGEQ
jgi:2'-5' RNA ligase